MDATLDSADTVKTIVGGDARSLHSSEYPLVVGAPAHWIFQKLGTPTEGNDCFWGLSSCSSSCP